MGNQSNEESVNIMNDKQYFYPGEEVHLAENPYIYAAELTPEELRIWLNQMADSAGRHNDGVQDLLTSVQLLALSAESLTPELIKKINFLSEVKIVRSENHSIAIQEELHLLREIAKSLNDFLESIPPLLTRLRSTQEKKKYQGPLSDSTKFSVQGTGGSDQDLKAECSHPHKSCE